MYLRMIGINYTNSLFFTVNQHSVKVFALGRNWAVTSAGPVEATWWWSGQAVNHT